MSEYGFWNLAQRDPEHLALVDPDGRELRAGELLARRRIAWCTGLRALGLQQGDCVATCLPNGAAMIETYLAAAQAGWYLTPINHHLTAGEMGYILGDCEAKAFIGAGRFAAACRGAADQAGLPASACYAVGEVPGFHPLSRLTDGQPGDAAGRARRRSGHELHLRHHRAAEGCAAGTGPVRSRHRLLDVRDVPRHVRYPTARGQRAPVRLAAVSHGRAGVRGLVAALRAHRRTDGQMDAGALPRAHPPLPRHHQPHGPHPVPSAAGTARCSEGAPPTSPRCAIWCTPPRHARST